MSKSKKQAMADVLGPMAALLHKTFNLDTLVIIAETDNTTMVVVPEDVETRESVDAMLRAVIARGTDELEPSALFIYLSTALATWIQEVAHKEMESVANDADAKAVKTTDDIIKGMKGE